MGVDQTKLRIRIPSGTVELDEIILGSTFKSVTHSDDYDPVSASYDSVSEKLHIISVANGMMVNVPSVGGTLHVYDLFGRRLYHAAVTEKTHLIDSNILNHSSKVIIIRYELNGKIYTNKKVLLR